MAICFAIFINSLQAHFMLAFGSENMWFAQLYFGGTILLPATLMAFLGSFAAMAVNYGIGWFLSNYARADHWSYLSETRAAIWMQRIFVWLLLLAFLPFSGIIAAVAGLLRTTPRKTLLIIALGRIGYYLYYMGTVYSPISLFS